MSRKKLFLALPLALAASLAFTACTSAATETEEPAMEPTESETMEVEEMDPAAYLVGPGCAAYAEQVPDGPGSVAGMFESTVVEAASNNPLLTTLAAAVSGGLNPNVNLVDTLNGGEFTVFAPVDEAFAKIDAATIETLKTDSDLLTSILTYHVVSGQALPDDLPGMHTTVQGTDVEVTGSGDMLMVNGANVICGGVQTENATVYLIDSVLLPTS
ncbi:fasciclin domain-containing protein [Leucobacter sp. Z1108]|uniref:fasciclin domain-containing protein n=1 Tax=Leucobacter sp. Z1108 TaxID=3439066 RepID=UPI003F2BD602